MDISSFHFFILPGATYPRTTYPENRIIDKGFVPALRNKMFPDFLLVTGRKPTIKKGRAGNRLSLPARVLKNQVATHIVHYNLGTFLQHPLREMEVDMAVSDSLSLTPFTL
jgi:hypothetical protein